MRGIGGLKTIAVVLCMGLTLAASAQAREQCNDVFASPVAAHEPRASLSFVGGYLSGAQSTELQARSIRQRRFLTPSCETGPCSVTGEPAARLTSLPRIDRVRSRERLHVRWWEEQSYDNGQREFRSIHLGWASRLRLIPAGEQWNIDHLHVGAGATLVLPAGDYQVRHLTLGAGASIEPAGEGTVRLHLGGNLTVPFEASLGDPGGRSEKLLLLVDRRLQLGVLSEVHATVYAGGQAHLGYMAYMKGDIAASRVHLGWFAEVEALQYPVRSLIHYEWVCQGPDLDGDGVPDYKDPDIDGDGVDNDVEGEYGTDPRDPQDYPDLVPPELTTTLEDGFRQEPAELTVTGTATDSGGPYSGLATITLTNLTTGETVAATLDGPAWSAKTQLVFGTNSLLITARDQSGNETVIEREVIRHDVTPPVVELAGPDSESVEAPAFTLEGSADDGPHGRGVESITAVTDRFDEPLVISREGQSFSAETPLQFGDNVLTVTATDGAGLTTEVSKTVTRIDTVPPSLTLNNADGEEVRAPSTTISGVTVDNDYGSGVASVTLTSDRGMDPVTATLNSDGTFSATVSLMAGANQWTVISTDKTGNAASAGVVIIRPDLDGDGLADDVDPDRDGDGYTNDEETSRGTDPDDGTDFPDDVPPEISIHNESGAETTDTEIVVTGHASDNRNLAAVTLVSDRYAVPFTVELDNNGDFRATVPLRLDDNTITVTARDGWDNTADAQFQLLRLSPPKLSALSPADGSVLKDDRMTLEGAIVTKLSEERLSLEVNGSRVAFAPRQGEGYPFRVENLPLSWGANDFVVRVSSPHGTDTRRLNINRLADDPDSIPEPEVSLLAPNAGQWFSGEAVDVVGRVQSHAGRVTVTVNGNPVNLVGSDTLGSFSRQLYFPGQAEVMDITVAATDQLGRSSSETVTVHRDLSAPVISLDNDLAPAPADNPVNETPLRLSGTVTDPHLSGMLINGSSPELVPDGADGRYRFTTDVALGAGSRTLQLIARDDAGNVASQSYQVTLAESALLTPLLPEDGARFATQGEPVMTAVAARLAGTAEGASARVLVDGQAFPLTLEGTALRGEVALPATTGTIPLRFEVTHPDSGLVAAAGITVQMQDRAAEPLRLVGASPAFNSDNVGPNQLLTLHFNKAVDPANLNVEIRETLHGPTYINNDPSGVDFLRAQGYQIQQVHRDRQLVSGAFDLAPGGRALSFKPDRFFGYGAQIYVSVEHNDESLGRGSFHIEPLPTQVSGGVVDQFGQPVPGVTVTLGELSAVTGEQGGFAFGFEDNQQLSGGNHTLTLNPGSEDPRVGSRFFTVYVEPERFTKLGVQTLPLVNEEAGYDVLQSGISTRLANNAVEMDLTNATVSDRRGRGSVTANLLFLEPGNLGLEMRGTAPLYGVYALQPEGVEVSGTPQLTLPVPAIGGNRDWAQDGDLMFVVGLNERRDALEPMALAEVQGERLTTTGAWHGPWLDYFGVAPIPAEAQPAVQAYQDNNGSWGQVRRAMGLQ